jgi:hypothetical protein
MSQKSAAWNLAFLLMPAVGLFAFLIPMAKFTPMRFVAVSAALYTVGLCLFVVAKASVFRQGRYRSWGTTYMSAWNRRAYRTGYVLMICGIVTSVVFTVVWQSH